MNGYMMESEPTVRVTRSPFYYRNIAKLAIVYIINVCWLLSFQPTLAALSAHIQIAPGVVTGKVNRGVLGNNVNIYNGGIVDGGGGLWDLQKHQPVEEYEELIRKAGVSFLRWPGGDASRTLDWRQMVGPLAKRSHWKFGLPEFLRLCVEVGAQPVITVATNVGDPSAGADLVEYLNAPDNGTNPNGGVDWAAVRRADGHQAPWDVIWFEYGNEEFNTPRSVDEYTKNYSAYRQKMKGVDKKIRLGAVFEDTTNVDDGWTVSVLQQVGKEMDFGIVHPYFPKLNEEAAKVIDEQQVALASVSADADIAYRLGLYRDSIKRLTGRSDLPIAATEYNGLFNQEKPICYRQTLVNALHNADSVRVFLKPEFRIAFANFWLFSNCYWGMVTGYVRKGDVLAPQANFYVYQLYNDYLSDELVKMDVSGPRFEFKGGMCVSPRIGLPSPRQSLGVQVLNQPWNRRYFKKGTQFQSGNIVSVDFAQEVSVNYYHAYKEIAVEPDTFYKIGVKMRTKNLKGAKIGIAVEDTRGWGETFYQPGNIMRTGTTPWSWATVEFKTLADTRRIRVMARLIGGKVPVSGHAEFGEVRVEKIKQNFGAVESVVGTASRSDGGAKVTLVLINKNLSDAVDTTVQLEGNYRAVKAETLTGPSPFATNLKPGQSEQVKIMPLSTEQKDSGVFLIKMPAASVCGIKFERMSAITSKVLSKKK